MAQFASDTFTGVNTTLLQDYSANWVKHSSASSNAQITATNTVRLSTTNQTALYYNTGTPASADYEVSCDLVNVTNRSHSCGVCGRMDTSANTFYYARLFQSATVGEYKLFKFVAGTLTQLGSTVNFNTSAGVTYSVKLRMVGSTIELYKQGEGTASVSATDSAITAAGKAGIRLNSTDTASNTTGMHIDNFSADDVAGAGTIVDVPAGSISLTGFAPSVVATEHQTVAVPVAALVLTGFAPAVSVNASASIQVPTAALSLTGFAPSVLAPQSIAIPAAGLTLNGFAPNIHVANPVTVAVPVGALTLTSLAPTVATTSHVLVRVPAAELMLTGFAPTIIGATVQTQDVTPGVLSRRSRLSLERQAKEATERSQSDPYRDIDWSLVQRRLEQSIARDKQRKQNTQKLLLLMAA